MGRLRRRAAEEVESRVGELAALTLQVCRAPLHLAHNSDLVWQAAGLSGHRHRAGEVALGREDLPLGQVLSHHVLLVALLDEDLDVPCQLSAARGPSCDGPVVELKL